MFDFLDKAVSNVFNIVEDAIDFNIDGDKVKQFAKDGLTVYEIASMYNVSTNLIESILED